VYELIVQMVSSRKSFGLLALLASTALLNTVT
jgi:hypothetical protein